MAFAVAQRQQPPQRPPGGRLRSQAQHGVLFWSRSVGAVAQLLQRACSCSSRGAADSAAADVQAESLFVQAKAREQSTAARACASAHGPGLQ